MIKKIALMLTLLFSSNSFANDDLLLRKNIIIIFDDSGSMRTQAKNPKSRLSRAKEATIKFVSYLPENYNLGFYGLNRGYKFPLQTLDEKSLKQITQIISTMRAKGATPIAKAINKMINKMQKQKSIQAGYGTYTIVIATDGAANKQNEMLKAVDKAIDAGIEIKTIGIDIGNHTLKSVTTFTEASSVEQLVEAMKKAINSEINLNSEFLLQDF
jgi:uncharacterized protein with von Willebrand factor type A (vWA) domain